VIGGELARVQIGAAGDDSLFERVSQLRYSELLRRCIRATSVSVFSSPMAVSLVLGPFWFMSAGMPLSWEWLLLPLAALKVGIIAALIGILPALLMCAPLWALLLRWRAGDVISFAGVGALPGILLMAWESEVGIAFLLYGVPASAMCWWLLKRWLRSDGV
jgi:hypothetical protein